MNVNKVDATKFPLLAGHLNEGTIFVSAGSYIGTAWDGVEVSVGEVGMERDAERYLGFHPERGDW